MTKNEMDALAIVARNRQLTKKEVLALHEAARRNINDIERKVLNMLAHESLKDNLSVEKGIPEEAIYKKMKEIKKSGIDLLSNNLKEADVWSHMLPRKFLDNIEYHVVDHCNLKCAACGHFSNIAEDCFANLEKFRSDYKRFVKVMGDKLKGIILMGGEPLLHPSIEQFVTSAHQLFPDGTIDMFTNGILLKKMPESFWKNCATCGVKLIISIYPLNLDIEEIKNLAVNHGVNIQIASRLEDNWVYGSLDLSGKQNIIKSFILCSQANNCHQLKDGKIFPCSTAAYIEHFNKAFGVSLSQTDKDSLDIFRDDIEAQDVLNFLSQPVPFCRYCSRDKFTLASWRASNHTINEWLDAQ